ncbi:hypothetical protein [Shewanella sp. Arc9-LZ]|uniref:hypothetical protein n=1 Tax=Shewanella sp. Arc9-LZ TaxID=2698686 RepID=UPI00137BE1E3|nr:hypothetical protein [Shewanella sp. Arc9-LZ]QHS12035.1 hypothetical protein GUY17_02320 [Shewanella sp. Arc9-LZ]
MTKAIFDIDSNGKAVNVTRLQGITTVNRDGIDPTDTQAAGDWLIGFGSDGHRAYFLGGDVSPEKKDAMLEKIADNIGTRRCLPLPDGGKISVDIIDEIYMSTKTDCLIISSIAPRTLIYVAGHDWFSDFDEMLKALSEALVDISNGRKSDFKWDEYLA